MDLNDIRARTSRIYISIGMLEKGASHDDIYVEVSEGVNEFGDQVIRKPVRFREDGSSEVLVNSVVDNLAHLKDPLKKKMELTNQDPQLIENEINENIHLAVLIDLANSAKHGYPLTKHKRSGMDPRIIGVEKVFKATQGVKMIEDDGTVSKDLEPTIFAQIVDLDDKPIMILDKLVDECCKAWEAIIKRYNLT